MDTLASLARAVLLSPSPSEKVTGTRALARAWAEDGAMAVGEAPPPDRPARPARPELRPPRDMPRRGKARSRTGRIALLHALAHIELNAIDLACDMVCRFTHQSLPGSFYDDWMRVADEEARHFRLLSDRLEQLDATYGDLPAHDGLWQAARETAHDVLARLAVVPLVLEARGLDVTPGMIANLRRADDPESADILEIIYREEIGHVEIGLRWFAHLCRERDLDASATYHDLVRRHIRGPLKAPFNDEARRRAGLTKDFYAPLAG